MPLRWFTQAHFVLITSHCHLIYMVFSITESPYETSEKMDRERKEKPWFILLWNRRWGEVMNDLLCHEMKFWIALTDCWTWESGLSYTCWLFSPDSQEVGRSSVDLLSYTLSPDQTTKPAPVRRENLVYMEGEKHSAATSLPYITLCYTSLHILITSSVHSVIIFGVLMFAQIRKLNMIEIRNLFLNLYCHFWSI